MTPAGWPVAGRSGILRLARASLAQERGEAEGGELCSGLRSAWKAKLNTLYCYQKTPGTFNPRTTQAALLLGGSWVDSSGVISPLIWTNICITPLVAVRITHHSSK